MGVTLFETVTTYIYVTSVTILKQLTPVSISLLNRYLPVFKFVHSSFGMVHFKHHKQRNIFVQCHSDFFAL